MKKLPPGMTKPKEVSICWLRRDLRLFDNNALYQALKGPHQVLTVFIFDTNILDKLADKKDKRVAFIHQTLNTLKAEIKETGSSLYALHNNPLEAFKTLCTDFDVKQVHANHDYEPYAIERDECIRKFLHEKNIPFHTYKDQVIFEKSEVMKADGSPYTVFTPYSKIWKLKYAEIKQVTYKSEDLFSNFFKTKAFHFPSLKELGFEKVDMLIPDPGVDEKTIRHYHETRNQPAVAGTSQISVHMRFGTVSVRQLTKLASRLNQQWLNELIWREFFMMILFHFPYVVSHSFKEKYDHISWRNNEKEFELWCKGQTGYPMVDAGMRQLNETGWMHNRVRMIVASFLTKHLLIDWRWGEAYFAEKLLDYELSSNNGNWQWAAGSGCDAAPYFRIFNPSEQIRKFDPELKYIKTWIKNFKPDYLRPIVEHEHARKRAIEVYKKSLNGL